MYKVSGIKRCKKCRAEILKRDKVCINCGRSQTNWLAWILCGAFVVGLIVGYGLWKAGVQ